MVALPGGTTPGNRRGCGSFASGRPISPHLSTRQGGACAELFFQVTRACVYTHSCTQRWCPGLCRRGFPSQGEAEISRFKPKVLWQRPFSLPRGTPMTALVPGQSVGLVHSAGSCVVAGPQDPACLSVGHQQPLHVPALECLCSLAAQLWLPVVWVTVIHLGHRPLA